MRFALSAIDDARQSLILLMPRPSEAVIYTTIAVVSHFREDSQAARPSVASTPVRRSSGTWRQIANGAWAQLHLFLEMDHDARAAKDAVVRHFRLVAWILETGRVIVNDVLGPGCEWESNNGDDGSLFRQFTAVDGHVYRFQFRSAVQADACTRILEQILADGDGESVHLQGTWPGI